MNRTVNDLSRSGSARLEGKLIALILLGSLPVLYNQS